MSTLTIGDVLNRLQDDFPDITASKIRFLETEGLVELERQLKLRDEVVRFKTVRPELRVKKPA